MTSVCNKLRNELWKDTLSSSKNISKNSLVYYGQQGNSRSSPRVQRPDHHRLVPDPQAGRGIPQLGSDSEYS